MSRLTKANSSKTKSKEFGIPHNEKAWREKRVTRKALRDRKRKVQTHHSSLKSKLHRRRDWKTYAAVEKNEWENEGDDFTNYMFDEWDMTDDQTADEYDDINEWGERPEITAIKMKHERESAQDFVNLIGDLLGGEFHGQEFVRSAFESGLCYESKPPAEFRIVIPDTTPRTPEVWISLAPLLPFDPRNTKSIISRSIRLFRSGSNSLSDRTMVEFLDGVLNEIVQDLFAISVPTTLVAIVSSFCNDSGFEFESLAECCLTIGGDDSCYWFPGQQQPARNCCCYACAPEPRCTCDDIHDISMTVSARTGCDDEYWQLFALSHDWKEMAANAFGQNSLTESSFFDAYCRQQRRHVRTIMRMAKLAAVSWDEPAVGIVVLPYKEEPVRSSLNALSPPLVPLDQMCPQSSVVLPPQMPLFYAPQVVELRYVQCSACKVVMFESEWVLHVQAHLVWYGWSA